MVLNFIRERINVVLFCLLGCCVSWNIKGEELPLRITGKYLNIPVSHRVDRGKMSFSLDGKIVREFVVRLAQDTPDYWVFTDVSAFRGKVLRISWSGDTAGLRQIYQSDEIAGQDSLYKEYNRPQLHFTPRRGWNNDPNGLIYYEGEYHLFYQHNPYEREWENMHWGHAVSRDLIHWKELPEALYPDHLGMVYSGSTVMDYDNTAGFNRGKTPAMIALYTAASPEKQVQALAYSLDRGRSWTKYAGNPVIDSKVRWNSIDTRDPKVFWYAPGKHWVLVLNERDGHSIYTSGDLKAWTYQSHVSGFWECPELFELPVDGNPEQTLWVMYGASGTYMLGDFDGKRFIPRAGKYYYTTGTIYAAQTFSNLPAEDGRRIQMGWGRVTHPGMPFNGMMLLPTELSLRTTKDGVRLFSVPVRELEQLQTLELQEECLTAEAADRLLQPFQNAATLRLKVTLRLSHATDAGLNLFGQSLLHYDLNANRVNDVFYSPEDPTSLEISADIILDKTSVEVFIDDGIYSYSMERRPQANNREGFRFWGNRIEVKHLEVYSLKSIWK